MATKIEIKIREFIKVIEMDADFSTPAAKLPEDHKLIKEGRAQRLRSYRHNLQAMAFDSLGNLTALHEDGYIRQHIGEQEINKVLGLA